MLCANGGQSNALFHPLVIHMMKTRLDPQVAAELTVKLYNVVQLCYDCLPGCACIVSGDGDCSMNKVSASGDW